MQDKLKRAEKIVILGMGGTIAGRAASASDNIGYTAAQVGVEELVHSVPGLDCCGPLAMEQIAQVDSKDMSFDVWTRLAQRVAYHLAQDDLQGIVVTHGTDTLEETAFFLHALLAPVKPVVLTCAMRPSTALSPDGPQNLLDSIALARAAGAGGVMVVCAGTVHTAIEVQKTHTYALNAFSSGDAGPLAYVEEGQIRWLKSWPAAGENGKQRAVNNLAILEAQTPWPQVEMVVSYAGAQGGTVRMLQKSGVHGIVVAATGNGTVHHELEQALLQAQEAGVAIVRATRCLNGRILSKPGDAITDAGALSPVKARVQLMLKLIGCQT